MCFEFDAIFCLNNFSLSQVMTLCKIVLAACSQFFRGLLASLPMALLLLEETAWVLALARLGCSPTLL